MRDLFLKIDKLNQTCQPFLDDIKTEEKKESDIILQLKVFNELIAECKEELSRSTNSHKEYILQSLYSIDTNNSSSEILHQNVEKFIKMHLDKGMLSESEKRISTLQKIVLDIEKIIDSLKIEYVKIINDKKTPLFFYHEKLKEIEKSSTMLSTLKKDLEKKLEQTSVTSASYIIEDFYNFYIFISFLLSTEKIAKNELLILEMINILDRYINLITPAFSNRSLQHQDMIYHYALYELKELKTQALKLF